MIHIMVKIIERERERESERERKRERERKKESERDVYMMVKIVSSIYTIV